MCEHPLRFIASYVWELSDEVPPGSGQQRDLNQYPVRWEQPEAGPRAQYRPTLRQLQELERAMKESQSQAAFTAFLEARGRIRAAERELHSASSSGDESNT